VASTAEERLLLLLREESEQVACIKYVYDTPEVSPMAVHELVPGRVRPVQPVTRTDAEGPKVTFHEVNVQSLRAAAVHDNTCDVVTGVPRTSDVTVGALACIRVVAENTLDTREFTDESRHVC
jgi:hypothetical protein